MDISSLLFFLFVIIKVPTSQELWHTVIISTVLLLYLFVLFIYLFLKIKTSDTTQRILGDIPHVTNNQITYFEHHQRRLSYRFAAFNFLLAFFSLTIASDPEVIRSSNGLLNAFVYSWRENFNFHESCSILQTNTITKTVDSLKDQTHTKTDSVEKKSDSCYIDCVLDISGSGKNEDLTIETFLNKKVDYIVSKVSQTKGQAYFHYAKAICDNNKCQVHHYQIGGFIIHKINLCYDIIRISEAYIENVFFKRPIIKVWFLGDSATYVDIKRTNYNGFYDISDTTDRNKLIIAILEEKINDIDLDKNTDFLGFFRMYKNDLWKMSGGRKILRDDYQFNKNNLFIFSDFLHDPKPNPGSSKDSDSCHLVNVLDSIEETQTNPSVHFMKAKREFVNGTTQVNKMLKAIFKDNCNVYSIYDSSFTLLKQRDTNFFYFTYKIPSHGSVRSVDFSLRRQENLAVKLSWVGNHTHYNPQFSLCLYSQDTCLDKLLLRNGLERDLTTAISKNRIDKFNIQYKGNVQPPYSEMELSIRNRLYGITTIHLLYFVKVYNLPVFVLLLILFLAMVILYSSLLYTTFSKIFPEIKQQVKNWLNEFFGGIGTNFKRIFVRYRNCYSLYCSPLADVFV